MSTPGRTTVLATGLVGLAAAVVGAILAWGALSILAAERVLSEPRWGELAAAVGRARSSLSGSAAVLAAIGAIALARRARASALYLVAAASVVLAAWQVAQTVVVSA